MDSELTVACVYKPGGGFTEDYVRHLHIACAQHIKVPHDFVCLTTRRGLPNVRCEPLMRRHHGYWNKLELFRRGLFDGPVIYFDLDTMILNDITDIATAAVAFAAPAVIKPQGVVPGVMSSSVMVWNAGVGIDFGGIDEKFRSPLREKYEQDWHRWGDQGWIQDTLPVPFIDLHALFPGRMVSYKLDIRPVAKTPPSASIVMFHGNPRPHQVGWRLP